MEGFERNAFMLVAKVHPNHLQYCWKNLVEISVTPQTGMFYNHMSRDWRGLQRFKELQHDCTASPIPKLIELRDLELGNVHPACSHFFFIICKQKSWMKTGFTLDPISSLVYDMNTNTIIFTGTLAVQPSWLICVEQFG
jgi:hypothetical protein